MADEGSGQGANGAVGGIDLDEGRLEGGGGRQEGSVDGRCGHEEAPGAGSDAVSGDGFGLEGKRPGTGAGGGDGSSERETAVGVGRGGLGQHCGDVGGVARGSVVGQRAAVSAGQRGELCDGHGGGRHGAGAAEDLPCTHGVGLEIGAERGGQGCSSAGDGDCEEEVAGRADGSGGGEVLGEGDAGVEEVRDVESVQGPGDGAVRGLKRSGEVSDGGGEERAG